MLRVGRNACHCWQGWEGTFSSGWKVSELVGNEDAVLVLLSGVDLGSPCGPNGCSVWGGMPALLNRGEGKLPLLDGGENPSEVKILASYQASCDTLQHGRDGYLITIRWGQKSGILMWTPVTMLAVGVDSLLQVGMKILSPYLAFVGGSRVTILSFWLE